MAKPTPVEFSIVVPCYNERDAIAETITELVQKVGSSAKYELIIVNDGSRDGTGEKLKEIEPTVDVLRVIHHDRNRGYGAALKTGIGYAKGELIVITDADGTYPNERIPELIDLCDNQDMVVGSRTGEDVEYSNLRSIPKFFLKAWVSWVAGQHVPDMNSGLRVFRRSEMEHFIGILPDGFSFTTTITLAMLTNFKRVLFVPISYKQRIGKSKIKPVRDTLRIALLIMRTGVYFAPLRLFAPFLLVLMIAALGSLFYDVFISRDLSDKTTLLFLFTFNTGMFALLADMIDKRVGH